MIDSWPGLLLPLWLMIFSEPIKKSREPIKEDKKIEINSTTKDNVDSCGIYKIKNEKHL